MQMLFDFPEKAITYLFGVSIFRGEYILIASQKEKIINLVLLQPAEYNYACEII